jgi:4-phospho-D-threonate 3-dehydrogenase / 4-phospho-D-erythronate 3-dehydrogenase
MKPRRKNRTLIGVTLGDPAGIGPEIVLKALFSPRFPDEVRPVLFGDRVVVEQMMEILGRKRKIVEISGIQRGRVSEKDLLLVPTQVLSGRVRFGRVSVECGRSAYVSFANAVEMALAEWIDGIATAPLHKEALRLGGCPDLDHTGILKRLTGSKDEATLFMTGDLRIFFLTRHVPLSRVPQTVTPTSLSEAIPRCIRFLKQLGIRNPRLAVAALNPHGGENGMFGREEIDTIRPVVEQRKKQGWRVAGPVPADSVFHLAREGRFDGVLSLYHDQGHIAAKTLDFSRTVSLTMGLPFLRTSVDHGVGFDIAGRGEADATSMLEAITVAGRYSGRVKRASKSRALRGRPEKPVHPVSGE